MRSDEIIFGGERNYPRLTRTVMQAQSALSPVLAREDMPSPHALRVLLITLANDRDLYARFRAAVHLIRREEEKP